MLFLAILTELCIDVSFTDENVPCTDENVQMKCTFHRCATRAAHHNSDCFFAARVALSNPLPNTAIVFSKALSMEKNVQDIHRGRAQR